ncbi:S8 family peptidase [Ascidiimonas sp. W6]|uniref:S8 family peptidase n=1 Tax=Ascidiimonas meishanensis TaxID=3128903 RepID=UPI0030EF3D18
MKKLILLFFVICLCKEAVAQEIIPAELADNAKKYTKEKLSEGFFLTSAENLKNFDRKSDLSIVRRVANNYCILYISGEAQIQNTKQTSIFKLQGDWMFSSALKDIIRKNRSSQKKTTVSVYSLNPSTFENQFGLMFPDAKILHNYKNNFVVELTFNDLLKLSSKIQISYVDLYHTPKTETPVNENDTSVNRINTVQYNFPTINGTGMAVSVKELLFDSTDIDFKNRIFFTGLQATELDQHAAAMGTVIAGGGNSSSKGIGVATAAQLTSSSFLRLFPDGDTSFLENNITVQNHSYGTLIENGYGNEAAAYDLQLNTIPTLLHIFSSGNSGTSTPENGLYTGIEGYANQTGNFKTAKNVLTVGAINRNGAIDTRSSKGPAYDGRVKPELVSYAPGGTSDASALVSGTAILLQQYYKDQNGQLPNSSLIRAVFIAGAEDTGPPAIDYQSGYGSINALQSMRILEQNNYREGTISQDQTATYPINIPENTDQIRIAISWNDVAANPGDANALVNDIDMSLTDTDNTMTLPWVLNSFPHIDSITKIAVRGEDHLNNNELISIKNPTAGTYILNIVGSNISASAQSFSIAYFIEEKDRFEWTYPTANDGVENEAINSVRWNNSFTNTIGQLEINSNDNGWEILDDQINLSGESTEIDFTNMQGTVQLRMRIGSEIFTSDVFGVSPEILPLVLYNCEDEIAFGWNKIPNAVAYQVNNLGERYMDVVEIVQDTTVILSKSTFNNPYFSITPLFENGKGIQGRTLNYELQGVNCYFVNFFAFLAEENIVNATLNLSTIINVSNVVFTKSINGITETISSVEAPFNNLNLSIEDPEPDAGINSYNAIITLQDGTQIKTDSVDIFIPTNETLIVYPNPYTNEGRLSIITGGSGRDLEIIDLCGRVLYKQTIDFIDERISPNLLPGIYIIRLIQDKKTLSAKKIIVR